MMNVIDRIINKGNGIVLFGVTWSAIQLYYYFKKQNVKNDGMIFCDNYKKSPEYYTGNPICKPDELINYNYHFIIICVGSPIKRRDMRKQLINQKISQEYIFDLEVIAKSLKEKTGGGLTSEDIDNECDLKGNYDRHTVVAKWIDRYDNSVIDWGAGDGHIETLLPLHLKYTPTDFIKRKGNYILYDWNKDPFPKITADVSLMIDVLTTACDYERLLKNVCCATHKKIIISFHIHTADGLKNDLMREAVRFTSENAVVEIIKSYGFEIKERIIEPLGDGTCVNDVIMLFKKSEIFGGVNFAL
ncbi:MAG: hypothetical protein IK990_11330 [Ruminiclostridium sp.]|nr:hypothetical protein [Ruminiclostridium sp.]